jgi:hypothetical protein
MQSKQGGSTTGIGPLHARLHKQAVAVAVLGTQCCVQLLLRGSAVFGIWIKRRRYQPGSMQFVVVYVQLILIQGVRGSAAWRSGESSHSVTACAAQT